MKKTLLIILCLLLVFTFAACGGTSDESAVPSGAEDGTENQAVEGDVFTFETETIGDEPFTSEDLKDAKLVIVNLWEPWCGPCVGEMPAIQQIYDEYKDKGVMVLGVFATLDQTEDALKIIDENGITYPILKMSREFTALQTQYVPTTVFMTGEGKLLSSEPVIGAQSYEDWKAMVKTYLEEVKND